MPRHGSASRPVPHASCAALAFTLLLPGFSEAQDLAAKNPSAQMIAGAVVLGVVILFLFGAYHLLRGLAADTAERCKGETATATTLSGRLMDLPLGVPEGSIRALVSLFIVVLGFLMLALAGPLGLTAGEALTGFIGSVISFYFATRSTERTAQAAEAAQTAAQQATDAVSRAAEAVRGATAAATQAGAAATNAATTVATAVTAAPGATPEQQSRLATLRDVQAKLQGLRSLIAVAGGLGVGTGAVAGADTALDRVDGLLNRIAPVLSGNANAETLGRLAEEAGGALRDLGDLGPVGNAVTDAMATIGRVAANSAPIASAVGGLLGGAAVAGPAGLVAAVVIGGLQFVRDKERFDRWKAAMLDTPLDLGLLPGAVDGGLVTAALLRSPLMAGRLAPNGMIEPATALAIWDAVGAPAGTAPTPARDLAATVLATTRLTSPDFLRGAEATATDKTRTADAASTPAELP